MQDVIRKLSDLCDEPPDSAIEESSADKRGKQAIADMNKATDAVEAMQKLIADGVGKIIQTLGAVNKVISRERGIDTDAVAKARERGKDAAARLESTVDRIPRIARMF